MSGNDYGKIRPSLKVVSLQICSNSANSVNSVCGKLLVLSFCSFENSVTEKSRISWLKNWNVFTFNTLFPMNDKRKFIKNPYAGKKTKAWNKPTKQFPVKWKMKHAKSDQGSYYNQGRWLSEHEYGKGWYYNEY